MVNASKIRARMDELGISDRQVALALSLSVPVAVQKLNNISALNLTQAETLADLLQLSDEDFGEYFFA